MVKAPGSHGQLHGLNPRLGSLRNTLDTREGPAQNPKRSDRWRRNCGITLPGNGCFLTPEHLCSFAKFKKKKFSFTDYVY